MSKISINRRNLLKSAGLSVAGVIAGPSLISHASSKPVASASTSGFKGYGNHCNDLADNRGFAYFGEPGKRKADKGYFPYHYKKANHVDYGMTATQEERAKALHNSLHIFDGEFEVSYYDGMIENLLKNGSKSMGGSYTIDALPFELFNGREGDDREIKPSDWWGRECMDRDIMFIDRMVAHYGDKIKICLNHADIISAQKAGQLIIMMDAQNTRFLEGDLSTLDYYYDMGLRRVQLSYNRQEMTATGCMEPKDAGVSTFGKECIARLNAKKILVDVGHCSSLTLSDAVDISTAPIICSHAGMRSIAPSNPRTHTDKGLKKLADAGGVFGVVGVPGTLIDGSSNASVKDWVNAIDKAVKVMGIEHVGFATDQPCGASMAEFLSAPEWPPEAAKSVGVTNWPWSDTFYGMENHSGYYNITRGLVAKGYSDNNIRKIMGDNMVRLVKEVIG